MIFHSLDAQRKNAAVNVASICLFATDVLKVSIIKQYFSYALFPLKLIGV